MTVMDDFFPETTDSHPAELSWDSDRVKDKWGYPRVMVRLTPQWSSEHGWRCGWFARVDNAVDEWPVGVAPRVDWPWYRPAQQPQSGKFELACATAGRAVKIVVEQMLAYATDADSTAAAREISDAIEVQARAWFMGEGALQ